MTTKNKLLPRGAHVGKIVEISFTPSKSRPGVLFMNARVQIYGWPNTYFTTLATAYYSSMNLLRMFTPVLLGKEFHFICKHETHPKWIGNDVIVRLELVPHQNLGVTP